MTILIPAIVGAGVCLFLLNSSSFTFFYLVPLGFISCKFHYKTAWLACLFASIGNMAIILAGSNGNYSAAMLNIIYFIAIIFIFAWITAPPPFLNINVPEPARLLIASSIAAIVFTLVLFKGMASSDFTDYVTYLLNSLISMYNSSGSDVVQNARFEMLTADKIMEAFRFFMLRGGSLISCVFLFFMSSQLGLVLFRLYSRIRGVKLSFTGENSLSAFHVSPSMIWVLSISLPLTVLTRIFKLEFPEIILWNILIICAILYFAQGFGILQFFTIRPSFPPHLRIVLSFLFIIVLFSPFLNAILLLGLVFLGLAENWVPIRASKQNGPPSTPEANDSEN